jgi:hypothetical protein
LPDGATIATLQEPLPRKRDDATVRTRYFRGCRIRSAIGRRQPAAGKPLRHFRLGFIDGDFPEYIPPSSGLARHRCLGRSRAHAKTRSERGLASRRARTGTTALSCSNPLQHNRRRCVRAPCRHLRDDRRATVSRAVTGASEQAFDDRVALLVARNGTQTLVLGLRAAATRRGYRSCSGLR